MKSLYILLIGTAVTLLFSSFASSKACSYAGANLHYVQARTTEALETSDINISRFYTYKAIKVIQTSTSRFNDCGCANADINIDESLLNLRAATKSTSIAGTKILLQEALYQISDALEDLEEHETHDTGFSSKEFEVIIDSKNTMFSKIIEEDELHAQIEISLESYKQSINEVIATVDCEKAHAYAKAVYDRCEKRLLLPNLSEGKKYYNLRTKEITAEAISRLGDCKK